VPIMSRTKLTIIATTEEQAGKSIRKVQGAREKGKTVIIRDKGGAEEKLQTDTFIKLLKMHQKAAPTRCTTTDLWELLQRYKDGRREGTNTIKQRNSWVVPEGMKEILQRNLRLDRNMQCRALEKYHSLCDEDKHFGALGNAYEKEDRDYEDRIFAHANDKGVTEGDLEKCVRAAIKCAKRKTPTRIVLTMPKWESRKAWQLIKKRRGSTRADDHTGKLFRFHPERGERSVSQGQQTGRSHWCL